jgi:hypothetical protein
MELHLWPPDSSGKFCHYHRIGQEAGWTIPCLCHWDHFKKCRFCSVFRGTVKYCTRGVQMKPAYSTGSEFIQLLCAWLTSCLSWVVQQEEHRTNGKCDVPGAQSVQRGPARCHSLPSCQRLSPFMYSTIMVPTETLILPPRDHVLAYSWGYLYDAYYLRHAVLYALQGVGPVSMWVLYVWPLKKVYKATDLSQTKTARLGSTVVPSSWGISFWVGHICWCIIVMCVYVTVGTVFNSLCSIARNNPWIGYIWTSLIYVNT